MEKTRRKNYKRIIFIVCIVVYVLLHALTVSFDRIGLASFNGVIMFAQFAMLIILVRSIGRRGLRTSVVLILISMVFMIVSIIVRQSISPLPGLCNGVLYILTLFMLNKQLEGRENDAITDMLTKLNNRRGLINYLDDRTLNDKPFHLVYIDLGNFKFINNNYGHVCGDNVLSEIARRISEFIGSNGLCSRIGGDEFVIVLEDCNTPKETVDELLSKIGKRITISEDEMKFDCYITAYAGIASYPTDSRDYVDLLKYADTAMYYALNNSKEHVWMFNQEMFKRLNRAVEIEKLIKEALNNDYFYLEYQPQYKLDNKTLRGFEALLRVKDSNGKSVSPGEFIPIAEMSDLIVGIDDFVLRRAMREFKQTIEGTSLYLSVNISAKNIENKSFADKLKRILIDNGFPSSNLEIEITEYCLVDSPEIATDNINALKELGVRIALDDFGTGYTSLSYLSKMPIDLLKIDKSLIDDIEKDNKRREFVGTVIQLGHQVDCEVISEGVENESQLSILKEDNCDCVQGFVWSKPISLQAARDLLGDTN